MNISHNPSLTTDKQLSLSKPKRLHKLESIAISLVGWVPTSVGKKLRSLLYRPIFERLGSSVQIHPGVEFMGSDRIEMGNNVRLLRDVRIRVHSPNSKVLFADKVCLDRGVDIKAHCHRSGDIEIGENTYIGPYTCMSGARIKIGKHCLIASHSGIYANNHNYADPTRNIKEQGNSYKGITIEDDCWLGCGVKVLDGVTIGKGSVIGAGAVVTKDIPPYSVAVGVPAKVVSKRTSIPERSVAEQRVFTEEQNFNVDFADSFYN